jgi:hypothetical protein
MGADKVQFKGAPFRLSGVEIRGCEPEVMKRFGWPWPWPLEVRIGKRVIAVCLDYSAALAAVRDWNQSKQGGV